MTRLLTVFAGCLVLALLALSTTADVPCDPAKVAVAIQYANRNRLSATNQTNYDEASAIEDDAFSYINYSVGTFEPKAIALEYGQVNYPVNGVPPFFHSATVGDPCSVRCLDDNTYELYVNGTFFGGPVDGKLWTTGAVPLDSYQVVVSNLRNYQRVGFVPGSNPPKLLWGFTTSDLIIRTIMDARPLNITEMCVLIMNTCTGANQAYASLQECLDFNLVLNATVTPCPQVYMMNTTLCRNLHAASALYDPVVHCPHTRAHDSVMCFDRCLSDCNGCVAGSKCVADYINVTIPHWTCKCNNGYTGNGFQQCTKNTCSADWQCPSPYATCVNGACQCRATFTWDPSPTAQQQRTACYCQDKTQLFWRDDGVPECIPVGRCRANKRWQCPQSNYNAVNCVNTTNPFTDLWSCMCNYGYCGGMESDCQCLAPKRELWSTAFGGSVCLTATECTDDWHCAWPQTCAKQSGNAVGECRSP